MGAPAGSLWSCPAPAGPAVYGELWEGPAPAGPAVYGKHTNGVNEPLGADTPHDGDVIASLFWKKKAISIAFREGDMRQLDVGRMMLDGEIGRDKDRFKKTRK